MNRDYGRDAEREKEEIRKYRNMGRRTMLEVGKKEREQEGRYGTQKKKNEVRKSPEGGR